MVHVVQVFFISAGDVLEMSVVRGVCGVRDMCMCLARGGVGGVGGERIGFGHYQFWRNIGKVGYVSVFWLRLCECAAWARVREGLGGVMSVYCCESGFSVLMAGPSICIL